MSKLFFILCDSGRVYALTDDLARPQKLNEKLGSATFKNVTSISTYTNKKIDYLVLCCVQDSTTQLFILQLYVGPNQETNFKMIFQCKDVHQQLAFLPHQANGQLTSRCISDTSVDFLPTGVVVGSAMHNPSTEDFKDFQNAEKGEFTEGNHVVSANLLRVEEMGVSGLGKTCIVLVLANGRVMVYEDLEFFENKQETFRFRLVESPMLLNANAYNSEDFIYIFQKERESGLQCFVNDDKNLKMNFILVPQESGNTIKRASLTLVIRHGRVQLHALGGRDYSIQSLCPFVTNPGFLIVDRDNPSEISMG